MNYVLYEGAKRGRAQVTEGMSLEKCYDYLQGRVYYSRRINSVFREASTRDVAETYFIIYRLRQM